MVTELLCGGREQVDKRRRMSREEIKTITIHHQRASKLINVTHQVMGRIFVIEMEFSQPPLVRSLQIPVCWRSALMVI